MNMTNLFTLAAAVPSKSVQATGWFLETAWLIPALPALSFPNFILWEENEIQRCRIRHHSYCTLIDSRNLLRRPMDEPSR